MPLDQLRTGLGALRRELEGEAAGEEQRPSLMLVQLQNSAVDLIKREMANARTAAAVQSVWNAAGGVFHSVDDARQGPDAGGEAAGAHARCGRSA